MMSKAARRVIFGLLCVGMFLAPVFSLLVHLLYFGRTVAQMPPGELWDWNFRVLRDVPVALLLGWIGVFLRSEEDLARVAVLTLAVCKLFMILGDRSLEW